MNIFNSLQARLVITMGIGVTAVWIAATIVSGNILHREMDKVLDSALQETAQRILPLAISDILNREQLGRAHRPTVLEEHNEHFTYIVSNAEGRVLLTSHAVDTSVFPSFVGTGFESTSTHRIYYETTVRDAMSIAMAEPIAYRENAIDEIEVGLRIPLLLLLPISLAMIVAVVRFSFFSVRRFRDDLAVRGAHDLLPVNDKGLPNEIRPISDALNKLFSRLDSAFNAERNFAANAAHEFRTPIAGALAHVQRLKAESVDLNIMERLQQMETSLKRLARLSEKLMQLARAEGAQLRTNRIQDLRPVLEAIESEFEHLAQHDRLIFTIPDAPVLSDIDVDALAIVCRNLIENALTHGFPDTPVRVVFSENGRLTVTNVASSIEPENLYKLTSRFETGDSKTEESGSGIGLAIVRTIAENIDTAITLESLKEGKGSLFKASVQFPTAYGHA